MVWEMVSWWVDPRAILLIAHSISHSVITGYTSDISVQRCIITSNEGRPFDLFGGVKSVIDDCIIEQNGHGSNGRSSFFYDGTAIFSNCVFSNNHSVDESAGIRVENGQTLDLINCTFYGNVSDGGTSGGIWSENSRVSAVNCVFWNNLPSSIDHINSTISIQYSDIMGGWEGTGNIDVDPQFTGTNDMRLTDTSPCIDAGTDRNAPGHDCDGNPRPCGGTWDMGAYEFNGFPHGSRLYLRMPAHEYLPGDSFGLEAVFWNDDGQSLPDTPFFALLMVYDQMFFMPEFNDFSYYTMNLNQGDCSMELLPVFAWPVGAGSAEALIIAALTNQEMSAVIWNIAQYDFSWSE
ncbi:right-handed parallel beta-helix repeat-containing protein [bacterium]|nr:right-handed parallel beta-helix repeat-containing protein [bacterium]